MSTKCHGRVLFADGAAMAACKMVRNTSGLTGSGVYFRMLRRLKIAFICVVILTSTGNTMILLWRLMLNYVGVIGNEFNQKRKSILP